MAETIRSQRSGVCFRREHGTGIIAHFRAWPVKEELSAPDIEIAGNGVEHAAGAAALVGAESDDVHGKTGEKIARPGSGIHAGGFADLFRRHPGNAFHSFRRIGGYTLDKTFPHGDALNLAAVCQHHGEGTAQGRPDAVFPVAHGVGVIGHGTAARFVPDEEGFRSSVFDHVTLAQQFPRIPTHKIGRIAPVCHKFAIKKVFGDDYIDPAQHERAAGAGAVLQPEIGQLYRFRFTGINGNDLSSPGLAFLDIAEKFRFRPGRVTAPDHRAAGIRPVAGGIVPVGEHFYLTAVAVAGLPAHGEDIGRAEQTGKTVAGKGKSCADHAVQADAHGFRPAFAND